MDQQYWRDFFKAQLEAAAPGQLLSFNLDDFYDLTGLVDVTPLLPPNQRWAVDVDPVLREIRVYLPRLGNDSLGYGGDE